MRKLIFVCIVLAFLSSETFSQSVQVSGYVTAPNGFAIRDAKVRSIIDKKMVLTDSAGKFAMEIHVPDNLLISYDGFASKQVPVTAAPSDPLSVQLEIAGSAKSQSTDQMTGAGLQNSLDERSATNNSYVYGSSGFTRGTILPSFSHKEDTKGSKYLLDDWTNGIVRGKDNNIITNSSFVYNYDKTDGSLIMTNDMKTAVTIDNSQIGQFTLLPRSGIDSITFVMQPLIDKNLFVQLLSDGKNYKLYKKIQTEFKKSNYQTTGLTSDGNNYDEYVDKDSYYVLNVRNKLVSEILLKQKSIKDVLTSDDQKVNSFFDDHKSNKIDEEKLIELINYLNL